MHKYNGKLLKTRSEIETWLKEMNIINATIDDNLMVSTISDVDISHKQLDNIPINFLRVRGSFDCSDNNLVTLKGSPREVGHHFRCINNYLKNLIGSPIKVGKSFNAHKNKLSTLEGMPQNIGESICLNRNELTSLTGCPEHVKGYLLCNNNLLETLQNCPTIVDGCFSIRENMIKSLVGSPAVINGDFICSDNKLTSLFGSPSRINGAFMITKNPITSLVGVHEQINSINGLIYLSFRNITNGGLGLFLVDGIRGIVNRNNGAFIDDVADHPLNIIKTHLFSGSSAFACHEVLIEKGLEQFAQI